jgi:hypothetical protein
LHQSLIAQTDIDALRLFVEVARRGSFAAVARDREVAPSHVVNGGQNPRNSGGDRKTGTELAGAIGHALPSFDPAPTAIWQPPVNAIAAEGGGRRPAFTGGCQIATLDE